MTCKEYFMGPSDALTHIPNDTVSGDHLIEITHTMIIQYFWALLDERGYSAFG
jgi:hypothetical protein